MIANKEAETISNDHKLEVAIVGLGKMGLLHGSLLNVFPSVHIAGLCDKSGLMRKIAKKTLKKILVTDKLDDLRSLSLDAIFITTPIPSHYSIIKEVFVKDITRNVFVEKTLSSTYPESVELFEMSKEFQRKTMVGYMKRFSVTFKKAKDLLNQQIIGKPIFFSAYAYSSDFVDAGKDASKASARSGVLEDLGSHIVDLALWFFGDMKVNLAKTTVSNISGSLDSSSFDVVCSENLRGEFDVSWIKEGYRMPEFGINVIGSNGKLMVDDNELKLELKKSVPKLWYRQDLNDNIPFLIGDPEYYREDEHFITSLISGSIPLTNFGTAMKVDLLLEEVRRVANE